MRDELLPAEQELAYRLAYDEAVRALSQQQGVIDSFRTRAGVLLSAAAVATSFFGGQALAHRGLEFWSWTAVGLFAGVGIALLTIMTPGRLRDLFQLGRAWEGLGGFVASPSLLIEGYIEADPPLPLGVAYRDVAIYMEERWDQIEDQVSRRLDVRFRIASLLLVAEIAAWLIDLS